MWWNIGSGAFRLLHADERGSVLAASDGAGTVWGKNAYDEFGRPGAGNVGRFQYTGQAWSIPSGGGSCFVRIV